MARIIRRNTVLAHHLVLHAYGQWLPNDLRGSGSSELREEKFDDLGPIHHGRRAQQPTREELRTFHRDAEDLLNHEVVWFREKHRQVIARAFGEVTRMRGYTVWAGAICSNHAHVVVRVHRNTGEEIWGWLAQASRCDAAGEARLSGSSRLVIATVRRVQDVDPTDSNCD